METVEMRKNSNSWQTNKQRETRKEKGSSLREEEKAEKKNVASILSHNTTDNQQVVIQSFKYLSTQERRAIFTRLRGLGRTFAARWMTLNDLI